MSGPEDMGSHSICAVVTAEFLAHQKSIGNDLSTPMPQYRFPGLVPGDRWCVTAANWLRAYQDGSAAPVVLASTHSRALDVVPLEALRQHSVDVPADISALDELPGGLGDPLERGQGGGYAVAGPLVALLHHLGSAAAEPVIEPGAAVGQQGP
jgi:uncharacterized protein